MSNKSSFIAVICAVGLQKHTFMCNLMFNPSSPGFWWFGVGPYALCLVTYRELLLISDVWVGGYNKKTPKINKQTEDEHL